MRILYIHQYFNTPSMVGSTRSYEFARRLVQQNHEVHIVSADRGPTGARYRSQEYGGMRIHWVASAYSNAMSFPRRIVAFAQFAVRTILAVRKIDADVVIATSTPLTVAIPGAYAARRSRCPFVFEVRDLWPEVPIDIGALTNPLAIQLARWLERFAYSRADEVIALSPGMAEGVLEVLPRASVTVIPNGSDVDEFAPDREDVRRFRHGHDWLQERPLVVYPGQMGLINGLEWLVDLALETLRLSPEVRFLIVGDGARREAVLSYAKERGVYGNNLFWLPPVPKSAVPTIFGAASLVASLVAPWRSLEHNSANKVFDAFAAGRPVLINHGGWQAELLRESAAGVALPYDDIPAAAKELCGLLQDQGRMERAGAAASGLARDRFSRDKLFDQFQSVVAAAVAGSRKKK
jgi:glycosyltransferase involved in cell wall biosynthesis